MDRLAQLRMASGVDNKVLQNGASASRRQAAGEGHEESRGDAEARGACAGRKTLAGQTPPGVLDLQEAYTEGHVCREAGTLP